MIDFFSYFIFILVIVLSIIAHELGHAFVLMKYNPNQQIKIRFKKGKFLVGYPEHYDHLSRKQLFEVYFIGILFGFIPILIYWIDSNVTNYGIFMISVIYLSGTIGDFRNIWHYVIRGKE